MGKILTLLPGLLAAVIATSAAAAADIEVSFSDSLARALPEINAAEQRMEANFRKHRDERGDLQKSVHMNPSILSGTRWANEELIGKVEDYTLENLVSALVQSNLEHARIATGDETIRIHITRIGIDTHPVGAINENGARVTGSLTRIDKATGNVIARVEDLTANLQVYTTLDTNYDGPNLAYLPDDAEKRVGPALAYFIKLGLERLYDEQKFRRPVVINFER